MTIDMKKGHVFVRKLEEGEKPLFKTVVTRKPYRVDRLPDQIADPSDVRVGDTVRAYDFPGRKDCYMEGRVVGYAYVEDPGTPGAWSWRYVQEVERRVVMEQDVSSQWGIPEVPLGERVNYPAVNGTRFAGGEVFGITHTNFVEKV